MIVWIVDPVSGVKSPFFDNGVFFDGRSRTVGSSINNAVIHSKPKQKIKTKNYGKNITQYFDVN